MVLRLEANARAFQNSINHKNQSWMSKLSPRYASEVQSACSSAVAIKLANLQPVTNDDDDDDDECTAQQRAVLFLLITVDFD